MNANKFATGEILGTTGRSCEGADFSWWSSKESLLNPGGSGGCLQGGRGERLEIRMVPFIISGRPERTWDSTLASK